MLKDFNGLTQQLLGNSSSFRKMNFSVYNLAEEEFYVYRLSKLGYNTDIDDLEFMILDRENISNKEINSFKTYIEDDIQKNRIIIGILLYKGKKEVVPIAIKPKGVNVEEVIKES